MSLATPTDTKGGVPGVDRRHRFSDFYHERTNFQFIAHSKRWLIFSGTLLLISVTALAFRGLNLGIEFEGGTAWQVTVADDVDASVSDVREILDPLGFEDAKVSTLSGSSGESVRVQAEVVARPGSDDFDRARRAGRPRRSRHPVRTQRGRRRHLHVHAARRQRTDGRGDRDRDHRCRCDRSRCCARRPERHDHVGGTAEQPAHRRRASARRLRGRRRERSQHQYRRPDMGRDRHPQGHPGVADLLRGPGRLPDLPVRVEDGRLFDRGGDPRHHRQCRRVRGVPIRSQSRDRHRVPDDSRVLALRHRRRVRQDRREPEDAHGDGPDDAIPRW